MNRISASSSLLQRITWQSGSYTLTGNVFRCCRKFQFASVRCISVQHTIATRLQKKQTQPEDVQCRLFSTHKLKRPTKRASFLDDTSVNVSEDTVIFSYPDNNWKYTLIMGMGITLFLVLLNSSYTIYVTMKNVVEKDTQNPDKKWWQWWKTVNFGATAFRFTLSSFLVAAGGLMLAFSVSYPLRMVKQITLLRGGDKIIMTTYAPFGKSRTYDLPLTHVSAQWSKEQAKEVLPIKVKGKRFHFLINRYGHFPNQELFDNTMTLARKM